MAAALFTHDRNGGLGYPQRAEEVGLDLGSRFILGDLFDEPEVAIARVVDDDVEAAEMIVRLRDRGRRGGPVRDIQLDRQHRVAVLVDQRAQAGGVARGRRHPIAAVQCRNRPLAAEAARCTRDEPNFASHVASFDDRFNSTGRVGIPSFA